MSLITASNLAKSYGAQDLFAGVSLSIPAQARIALVGPNGCGKTTLLRILIGEESPTEGTVHRARGLRIGYLPQEVQYVSERTLWEECLEAVADLRAMEADLRALEQAMQDPHQAEQALARYGVLQAEFERRGGYTYESHIRQVLTGLGFARTDDDRPLAQLSGGQRTRAYLARLLIEAPDLLLLDEPTNHLDLAAVEWLENYLSGFEGAVLLVSHDRYFMNRLARVVWELGPLGLEVYRGSYDAYQQQRAQRWAERRQRFEEEIARMERELDYIRRNIAGQNTHQAQGKLRRLSRQIEALEKGGLMALNSRSWARLTAQLDLKGRTLPVDEAARRLAALQLPSARHLAPAIRLEARHRSGDIVLRTHDLEVGYRDEGRPLFRVPDLTLLRGECVAIVGPNGAGKTTFLKTLLGEVPPYRGAVRMGASVRVGYFAQAHEGLHPDRTLLDEVLAAAPHLRVPQARDHLARYLFTGDQVFKPVASLSGGERGRLALALLALSGANLLLLDEPTNHLDLPAQEALQQVLADFPGTILLVSHDRYLMDALASQVWAILPGQGMLQAVRGGYSDYRAWLEAPQQETRPEEDDHPVSEAERRARRRAQNAERKRQARLQALEERIHALEAEMAAVAARLENPPDDLEEVQRLGERYAALEEQVDALYHEWEALHD